MIEILRNLVAKDTALKLFSLALAVLLWFTIRTAIENQVSPGAALTTALPAQMIFPKLPVIILSSAADVRSFRVDPKEIEVTVQGDAKILHNLQSKDIRVLVDLTGIGEATGLRKRVEVSTPAGVTHVHIEPSEVQILVPPKN